MRRIELAAIWGAIYLVRGASWVWLVIFSLPAMALELTLDCEDWLEGIVERRS